MSVGESSAEPALRFYDVLGIMTALAFESDLHRNWSVSDLQITDEFHSSHYSGPLQDIL